MASGRDAGRKDSVFFKGMATGKLTMLQQVYGQHKLDKMFLFVEFLGEVCKGGRVDLGRMGSECVLGSLYEIP